MASLPQSNRCPRCGSETLATARHCANCGRRLQAGAPNSRPTWIVSGIGGTLLTALSQSWLASRSVTVKTGLSTIDLSAALLGVGPAAHLTLAGWVIFGATFALVVRSVIAGGRLFVSPWLSSSTEASSSQPASKHGRIMILSAILVVLAVAFADCRHGKALTRTTGNATAPGNSTPSSASLASSPASATVTTIGSPRLAPRETSASPTATSTRTDWTSAAVWKADATAFTSITQRCGSTVNGSRVLSSPRSDVDTLCIRKAMTDLGASVTAGLFFEQHQWFLYSFSERGRVDSGTVYAPWWNMSRSEPVFLNGSPSLIQFRDILPSSWTKDPANTQLVTTQPGSVPWTEYSSVVSSEILTDGGQTFVLDFPLRTCRACATVGHLRLQVGFDQNGITRTSKFLTPTQ